MHTQISSTGHRRRLLAQATGTGHGRRPRAQVTGTGHRRRLQAQATGTGHRPQTQARPQRMTTKKRHRIGRKRKRSSSSSSSSSSPPSSSTNSAAAAVPVARTHEDLFNSWKVFWSAEHRNLLNTARFENYGFSKNQVGDWSDSYKESVFGIINATIHSFVNKVSGANAANTGEILKNYGHWLVNKYSGDSNSDIRDSDDSDSGESASESDGGSDDGGSDDSDSGESASESDSGSDDGGLLGNMGELIRRANNFVEP